MMKLMAGMMPASDPVAAEMMKEMTSKLTPTKPMTFAVTFGDGRAQLLMRFPMEIIEKFTHLGPR